MKKNVPFCLLIFLLISCDKKNDLDFNKYNIQAVNTLEASDITRNSAIILGKINTINGSALIESGICYSITSMPTVDANKIKRLDNSSSSISVKLDKLVPETKYYVKAYAINTIGTAYGEEVSFVTLKAEVATVLTSEAKNITPYTVILGGEVKDNGGYEVTNRGICWSTTSTTPSVGAAGSNAVMAGNGIGPYQIEVKSLNPGVKYYVRAFAESKAGIGYGSVISSSTNKANVPENVVTSFISNIMMNSAVAGGRVGNDGGSTILARGICFSNSNPLPTINNSIVSSSQASSGEFSVNLTGIQANTTYYARAYASNSIGIAYGAVLEFKTSAPSIPSGIGTNFISNISTTQATGGGYITSDGGAAVTSKGLCYSSTASIPTFTNSTVKVHSSGIGNFTLILTDLTPKTTYYVRAYATNSSGTSYGPIVQFTTLNTASTPSDVTTYAVSDITSTSVLTGGNIGYDGGSTVVYRGVCYSSVTSSPTISNATSNYSGSGIGGFSIRLSGLKSNTKYYVRSFAINSFGTTYGNLVTFTTNP